MIMQIGILVVNGQVSNGTIMAVLKPTFFLEFYFQLTQRVVSNTDFFHIKCYAGVVSTYTPPTLVCFC